MTSHQNDHTDIHHNYDTYLLSHRFLSERDTLTLTVSYQSYTRAHAHKRPSLRVATADEDKRRPPDGE